MVKTCVPGKRISAAQLREALEAKERAEITIRKAMTIATRLRSILCPAEERLACVDHRVRMHEKLTELFRHDLGISASLLVSVLQLPAGSARERYIAIAFMTAHSSHDADFVSALNEASKELLGAVKIEEFEERLTSMLRTRFS